jgi:glycine/D-amino acid oxidase-like deaminating enzyme
MAVLNAPATGEAVAELILDGVTRTADLAAFDPARLRPHVAAYANCVLVD